MASEVIDLLGTTSEEEDENSDAGKLKLLRNIVGATPSIERLTSLIEQAGGDVQGAANLFFDIPSGPDADILQVIGTSDNVRPSVPISPALDPPGVASAQGQQSSSQKLQVGAVVTVSANCDARNLLDGCLAEHEHGTVIEVVDDSEPYQVRNEHGVTWWYRTHDLMQADTPEQAREMPGSQVKREGQPKPPNKRPANIDDPDCVVADSRNAKRPATSVVLGEADDDVQISGADDPMILVAHARFNCRMLGMSFSSRFGQSDRSQNQKHCPQCYCYVCDVEAAKCTTWSTHCMADGSQVWQEKRQERKEAATGGSAGSNGAAATSIQPNPPGGLSFGRNPLAAGRAGSAPVRSRSGLRSPTGSYDLDNFVAALPSCVEPQQGNPPTGYRRAKLATGLPSHGQAGWPRLAGTVEFLMPRCIMHTHATIPDNTAISQYFCLEHSSALVLLNGKWQPQGELVSDLTTLQSSGQCHLKWEVHHADRDISDTVAKKLELLRKHRPFTFDLTRKWVPEITYRSATKIFEDRPAQAEGNMEWWNHVKELTCVKCPPPVSGVHHKGGRALHARPPCGCDTELRSALCKLENRGGNESHDPSNCCRFVCHVSFDKSITINTHAQGDSRQSFANSVRRIMKHLQLRGFPDPALQTPVPPLQVTDTPQALQKLAERELSQAKYEEAELAFTASLNVSLPHRLPGKSGSTARRECMIGRATARLELHDYSGAMHDLSIVLSKSNRVGEALHLYGRALMKQNKPKDAIGFLAKAIEVATKDPESKAIYEATMNEANAVLRAAAESEATIARVTLHVHNLYGSQATSAAASDSCSVNLWWAKPKTNCEQPRVVTVPGSRYVFQNHTHVTCLYQKEYDHLKASRMRTEIRAGRVSSSSCYNDSSHLRDDLGIVLVPQSSPPRVQNKTKDARVTNSRVAAGMVLAQYGFGPTMHSTDGKTAAQVSLLIKNHKRPIKLVFQVPQVGDHVYLGTLAAYNPPSYMTSRTYTGPRATFECAPGSIIHATSSPSATPSMADMTYKAPDVIWSCVVGNVDAKQHEYIVTEESHASQARTKRLWKLAKAHLEVSRVGDDSLNLLGTEGAVVKHHIERFSNMKALEESTKYSDLRVLQDSPLFGLSEGYKVDGKTRTLPVSPPELTVTLRKYQSQAVQWMIDRESRSSVSDRFWVKVPLGICPARRGLHPADQTEAHLWYCHASGTLSEQAPAPNVGGVLAEEMGLGKTIEVLSLLSLTTPAARAWQGQAPASTAAAAKPRGGTLIVCPVSLFGQWKTEIRSKLADDHQLTIYDYHTGRSYDKNMIASHDIVLTTFSILNREEEGVTQSKKRKGATGSAKNAQSTKIPSPLKEIEWYRVVLDEVHAIKTAHTKQARYCLSLQTRRRWAVTGTVMQTQHDDIATVLQFLRLDPLGIRHMWNNYCGARLDTSRGWRAGRRHRALQQHDAPNPLALLSFTMRDIVMRHTKTQIFEGEQILKLPARTQSVVMLDMSEHEKNLYKELEQQAQTSFAALEERGQIGKETLRLMSLLLPLRMLCSDPAALSTKQLTPTSTDTASNDDSSAKLLSKQSLKDLFTQKQMAQERIDSIICVLDGSSALTCPVCLDLLDSPASTACGHTFCLECINSIAQQDANTQQGPCPNCRAPVKATELYQLTTVDSSAAAGNAAGDTADTDHALSPLLAASQLTVGSKIKALLASLQDMAAADPQAKAVVFSQFSKTHSATVKALQGAGLGVVQIHGAMTQKARSRALERFIADPTVTVFALSLRSGAVGLTLTAASRCYLLEPCLNEGTELQAVNRIHRLGQTKKVQIVTFVSKNSVEQRLLQLRAERAAAAAASTDPTAAATEGPAGGTAAHPAAQASAQDAAVSQPSKRRAGDKRKSLSTNQMANFNASAEKLVAQLDEWKLLFGCRAAKAQVDMGDPLPPPSSSSDGQAAPAQLPAPAQSTHVAAAAAASSAPVPPAAIQRRSERAAARPRKVYGEDSNEDL